jgi:hypothetical protein
MEKGKALAIAMGIALLGGASMAESKMKMPLLDGRGDYKIEHGNVATPIANYHYFESEFLKKRGSYGLMQFAIEKQVYDRETTVDANPKEARTGTFAYRFNAYLKGPGSRKNEANALTVIVDRKEFPIFPMTVRFYKDGGGTDLLFVLKDDLLEAMKDMETLVLKYDEPVEVAKAGVMTIRSFLKDTDSYTYESAQSLK